MLQIVKFGDDDDDSTKTTCEQIFKKVTLMYTKSAVSGFVEMKVSKIDKQNWKTFSLQFPMTVSLAPPWSQRESI